ncbi:MAG: tryptophan-rich sensory protein [Chitinophagaceae bacterium]|nr:tryptophan-rich sensory protein [Chitinophagaceae bacterium]
MNKTITFILCILLTLAIGSISGIATAQSVDGWFTTIIKPSFNPPNSIFGPVWTLLYLLMGISFYLVLTSAKNAWRKKAIIIFSVQLFLNFCWSFLFFKFHWLGIAFIEILLIWLSIIMMITIFYKVNKTAALLQIPYLLWVSFASVLNGTIWWLN